MKPSFPRQLGMISVAASLLAGCSLAPDYSVPLATTPAAFKEKTPEQQGWVVAQPSSAYPRGDWWHVFNDPILDALEAEVTDANQNLKVAFAQYSEARDAVDEAGSALFPVLNASASATRNRESKNRPLLGATSQRQYNDYVTELDATYEIDVFGRLRNALAASLAGEEATRDDLETLNLALHVDLATDYFQIRAQDVLVKILADTIKAYEDALRLTQQRFQQGVAAGLDVAQAQSQLELARAQQAAVLLVRARLEHAIALLVGESASGFSLVPGVFNPTPPVIPAGLPSELLQRRPDIASAEREVAAANSEIGVAEASFYPAITFSASGGFEGDLLQNFIEAPSRFWSIGPSAALTIFDAGERDAILAAAGETYNQQVATYRQTVLTAYQQVEDSLASIRLLDQEAVAQNNAVKAANQELTYANQRYQNGLNEYLDVITAQATLLQAQTQEESVLSDRLNARVSLIQALGGGWGPLPASSPVNPDPASLLHASEPGSVFEVLKSPF